MAGCDDTQFKFIMDTVEDGAFTSNKETFIKTVCQNFTFTSQQAGKLLGCFDFSNDRKKAIHLFAAALVNPNDSQPILAAYDSNDDKQYTAAQLKTFKATPPRQIAPHRIEDDGHRSKEAMTRLFTAIDAASMSSDKVKAMQNEITTNPTPPFDVSQLVDIIKKFSFSNDREAVLKMLVGPQMVYPMTCQQLVGVLKTFSMSNDKIAVLPFLKPFIHDPQNKLVVVASFDFSSDKEKAEKILRDVVVNFKPPTPPAAAIQQTLKRIGKCPAGYEWRQVQSGWRCSAGGHFVSDAQLKQAM